jgi:DNA-binding XRE family transcriptional regulator
MPEPILSDRRSEHQWRPRAGRRSTRPCRRWKRTAEHHALGRALLELRARRGLSQEQLGFASGLHRNYVGAIERGEINPTFRVLLKLTVGLRLPLSELIAVYERHRAETPS